MSAYPSESEPTGPKLRFPDGTPPWLVAALITLSFTCLYAATAHWDDTTAKVDAVAAALPAWALAQHGSIDLTNVNHPNPWVVEGAKGDFSNRPPGTYLPAVPAYLLAGEDEFSTDPATWTAVLLTASAMGILFLVLNNVTQAKLPSPPHSFSPWELQRGRSRQRSCCLTEPANLLLP